MSKSGKASIIWRITKTELCTLFGSPIAWFILIVFSVLTSMDFTKGISSWLNSVELYGFSDSGSLASYIFLGSNGFFQKVVSTLFIYVPLLTMGLIARETSSGSIKLAYSSPVTSVQFVIGKYLASVIVSSCLLIVPLLATFTGAAVIPHFDIAPVLAGLLGLFLLICAYCAVGLFFSSITSYQVVAAVCTLATLAILGRISALGREFEVVRNITYWLSISGRTSSFLLGVIRTDDIVYFLAIILMFVTLTIFRISFPRKSIPASIKAIAFSALAAVIFLLGFVSSRPAAIGIADMTRNKSNSITEGSKAILAAAEGKIVINNYVNLLDNKSHPYLPSNVIQTRTLFEQYKRAKPDIEEHTLYYYAESPYSARNNARFKDMTTEQLRDYISMTYKVNARAFKPLDQMQGIKALEDEQCTFVREIVAENGRSTYLRDFNDMMSIPSEAEISASLSKLFTTPPAVCFITGNGERALSGESLQDYSDFAVEKYSRYALVNQGFDVYQSTLDAPVDSIFNMMVIADPQIALSEKQMENLGGYLDRGGNLIVLADYSGREAAAGILEPLGLEVSDYQIAEREGDFSASLILARLSDSAGEGFKDIGNKGGRVTMPGCLALEAIADNNAFTKTPLLVTGDKAWLESDFSGFKDDIVTCDNEPSGRFCTAYTLQRTMDDGKEQRIVVLGDADCFSNEEMTIGREAVNATNFSLITDSFRWISGGQFPIDVYREPCLDTAFRISSGSLPAIKAIFNYIIPALLLAFAGILLIRRRRG